MKPAPERDRPGDSSETTQDPWIPRFQRGDPEAMARVKEQALAVVRLQAWKIRPADRTDLVQDVMAEAWQRLAQPGFRTGRTLDAYVRSLAYWRCVDWLRRHRRASPPEKNEPDPAPLPDERVLRLEQKRLGLGVLNRLRRPCQELIQLHAVWGLTYRQISELLGRSEGALRVQMCTCLKEARRLVEQAQRRPTGPRRQRSDS